MKHQFRSAILLTTLCGAVAASYAMAQQESRRYERETERSVDFGKPETRESAVAAWPSGQARTDSPFRVGVQIPEQQANTLDGNGNVVHSYRFGTRYSPRQSKQQEAMQEALATLKDEKASGQEQDEAQETIAKILDEQFEQDMASREQRIEKLEEQIDQLRAQIEKRKDAKEKLIGLRIELMMNESEGLGFPSTWNSSNSGSRFWDRSGMSSMSSTSSMSGMRGFIAPPQAPVFPGSLNPPLSPEPSAPVGRASAPRRSSR